MAILQHGELVTISSDVDSSDEQRGASVDEVVEAIVALSRLGEAEIAERAASGKLREMFPFRIRDGETPGLRLFSDVEEALARALTDEEYLQFLRG